ncbi:FUSC family protein [Telluribacter sp. SYSU D00476]|uniref:FUSC family protein n=1 Tax=Telluribacter sp. SYSU D00476 TaxID=2811430 RepID=UPI001FF5804D|nr:FUSC family membrane protein [Telluribacter sp. SYSU D00476]
MTLQNYLTSEDTESAFRFTIGASIPLVIATLMGFPEEGIFLLLGALFVQGIDIAIALPKKVALMALTGVLSALIFVIFTQVEPYPFLTSLLIFLFVFSLSLVAPISASFSIVSLLISLSIMIGLSMAESIESTSEALERAGYILAGVGWYILYAVVMHLLQRPRQLRRRIQECLNLTADYFALQAKLFEPNIDLQEVLLNLSQKQGEVVEAHQQIREVLLREPINLTNPATYMGRATFFFANLVDIFELATASSWSIHAVADQLPGTDTLPLLRSLNKYAVNRLRYLADQWQRPTKEESSTSTDSEASQALARLTGYLDTMKVQAASHPASSGIYRTLRRVQVYSEHQLTLLTRMQEIMGRQVSPIDIERKQLRQFADRENLSLSYLRDHISLKSGFFRFALRTALTAVVAYYLATVFHLSHPSWALLTVLVIMKPGFSLSRQRLYQRVIGTFLGAVAGLVLFYVFKPGYQISMLIFLTSMFFAFSFIKKQYWISSLFFTVFLLFFYRYLHRELLEAAWYRLLDTLLAAALCWLSIRYVLPYWEKQKLPQAISNAIRANSDFFSTILAQLHTDGFDTTGYKLSRKEAYVQMDNLTNIYRLTKTESAAQKDFLNNSQQVVLSVYHQLSVLVNLGLFCKRHPTYQLRDPDLQEHLEEVRQGMRRIVQGLIGTPPPATDKNLSTRQDELVDWLARQRREVDQLMSQEAPTALYASKVHDLFWGEGAFELMELHRKLERLLRSDTFR